VVLSLILPLVSLLNPSIVPILEPIADTGLLLVAFFCEIGSLGGALAFAYAFDFEGSVLFEVDTGAYWDAFLSEGEGIGTATAIGISFSISESLVGYADC